MGGTLQVDIPVERSLMMRVLRISLLLAVSLPPLAPADSRAGNEQQTRSFTVADGIRMTLFGDPSYYAGGPLMHTALFSPNKKTFVVVLRRGNLKRNANEFSLLLWRTEEIFRSPTPQLLLTMSSTSNRNAISDVRWLNDSVITFLGENPGELRQLYSLNVCSRAVTKLTNHSTNVTAYSLNRDATKIAFFADPSVEVIWNDKTRRTGLTVSTGWLWDLVAGRTSVDPHPQLFIQQQGKRSRPARLNARIAAGSLSLKPHMSPDGKYVVVTTDVDSVPEAWKEYSNRFISLMAGRKIPSSQLADAHRYVLLNCETGTSRFLLDSPLFDQSSSRVAWSPDSTSVVITQTYLPLENTQGKEREERRSQWFAVEVQVATGGFAKIDDGDLRHMILQRWDANSNQLIFQAGPASSSPPPGTKVTFHKNGDKWQSLSTTRLDKERKIIVEEDMNTPPRLVAEDPVKHSTVLLLDLNPWFKRIQFGTVENIRFIGSDGRERNAGLYYPVRYSVDKRYPLVIQTHGWSPLLHRFLVNGFTTTSDAAQALAGQGIMVVQLDETDQNVRYTPEDGAQATAAYEDTIDFLDRKGLIDRDRVGIIGFSQTCYYVKYALTHSQYHFAAASVADGHDSGYLEYLLYAGTAYPTAELENEGQNGGMPFGPALSSWIDHSPVFKIDNVRTPMLITAINRGALMREWEWYAASTRLGKPVELLYIQDGSHELEKPWDRLISQEHNVDWFRFWLKGEVDPDSSKAQEYARWQELRKLQERSVKTVSAVN